MQSIQLDTSKLLGFRLVSGATSKTGVKAGVKAGAKTGAKIGAKLV